MNKCIALVDDHALFRKGITELINDFPGYEVALEADNGKDLTRKLNGSHTIDIAVLDINMKEMNGYETARWLQDNFPDIRILALSMYDDEMAVIKMLKAGAKGYLLKDASPQQFKIALDDLINKGYHQSDLMSEVLLKQLGRPDEVLNERELEFLKFSCTELTYKEIADRMSLSPRTIDGYRESLFDKLKVKNRVGLVMYAIKHGLVQVDKF